MLDFQRRLIAPLAALLAIATCALTLGVAGADAATGRYVALGDSNSTGSGLDGSNTVPGSPAYCYRTQNSYPSFSATALGFSDFAAATCSAAGIREFTQPQPLYDIYPHVADYAPPQFDALNGSEKLVTITIGGNDSGYGTYINACLQNSNPSATPCKDAYVSGGNNALVASARDGISGRLGAAIDQIHVKSPQAEVWIVGYPRITPEDVSDCPGRIGISAGDAPVFDAWQRAVRDYAKAEAEAHDAYFVDVYAASAGHDGCQPNAADRWSNPNPAATPSGAGWSLHPTLAGETAMMQLFVAAYNSPRPVRPIKDGPAPTGQSLSIKFSAKKLRASRSRVLPFTETAPAKSGARFTLTLTRSATVTFVVERAKSGRVKNGKCRALLGRAAKGLSRCTRFVRTASAALPVSGGESPLYFTGRANGKRLPEGKYRLRTELGSLSAKSPTFSLYH